MAGTGSVVELHILSLGLSALMGFTFIWLSLRDEKTSSSLRVALMQMGLLFMVNALIFIVYLMIQKPTSFGLPAGDNAYLIAISASLNLLTLAQIGILFTIFPLPLMNSRENAIKLGFGLIVFMSLILILTTATVRDWSGTIFSYHLGFVTFIAMGTIVLIRWYLLYRDDDEKINRNIASAACLTFFAFVGTGAILWPFSIFLVYRDFSNSSYVAFAGMSELFFLYLLAAGGALIACALLVIVVKEALAEKEKRDMTVMVISSIFFVVGLINLIIYILVPEDGEFKELWEYFVITGSFGLIRPLLLIIVALRFNLFDLTDSTIRGRTRIIALLIITVWASGFFEIFQAFIPMPQLLSAALIGVFLAFAIGWEDRIFENLAESADEKLLPAEDGFFTDDDPYRLMMLTIALTVLVTGLGVMAGGL